MGSNFEKTFPSFVREKQSNIAISISIKTFQSLLKFHFTPRSPSFRIDVFCFMTLCTDNYNSVKSNVTRHCKSHRHQFHHIPSFHFPYLLHGYSYFHTRRINRSVKRQSEWSNLKRSSQRMVESRWRVNLEPSP